MTSDSDTLKELTAQLQQLGLSALERVPGALAAVNNPALDDAGRLRAAIQAYQSMVDAAAQLVRGELSKVESLRASTPESDPARAALDDMAFAFAEQAAGLEHLRGFFSSGDKALLHRAREALQRGAATARRAAGQRS